MTLLEERIIYLKSEMDMTRAQLVEYLSNHQRINKILIKYDNYLLEYEFLISLQVKNNKKP
ncbi:hypothetical protein C5F64_16215 [Photobacterium damselae subsp. damselae]|uniref:Uncharacterized protein n=1 Tax=Photobacterium damselae subsp. damselae TaxID=85581 RepID=E4WLI6_PHODD|nr:hypothetical protein [Photobacterium damselae]PSB82319.1 hypothetical protein C5F64_16215 [Photobacterium damselae subsp. damselae]PSB90597.1 hypothetical protein C5F63_01250 [Photobacterium damselae subsp. damselae]CBX86904.1 hypothetical protein [Photobacterium damselae subsp. damselae]SPY31278.1 Uncharacterised protein [Photobacterium damselae]